MFLKLKENLFITSPVSGDGRSSGCIRLKMFCYRPKPFREKRKTWRSKYLYLKKYSTQILAKARTH